MKRLVVMFAVLALSPAHARVVETNQNGFSVSHEATVALPPQAAYEAFLKIGLWWSKDHTFSGDAKNMTIDAKPGGCWCENLPSGGFVKHMEVASAAPGERLVLHGGLGPLHFMAVTGAMNVKFEKTAGGTKVTVVYTAGGYDSGNFKALSPAVDRVIGEQIATYAKQAK